MTETTKRREWWLDECSEFNRMCGVVPRSDGSVHVREVLPDDPDIDELIQERDGLRAENERFREIVTNAEALLARAELHPPSPEPDSGYLTGHRASGIKVGDYVRVTRVSDDREGGWDNTWNDRMSRFVGKIHEVVSDRGKYGFRLAERATDDRWDFPYFVLQKVRKTVRPWTMTEACAALAETGMRFIGGGTGCEALGVDTTGVIGRRSDEHRNERFGFKDLARVGTLPDGRPCGVETWEEVECKNRRCNY